MNSMIMKGIGDRITFGHYRVLQRDDGSLWELGIGAMGVTYKALDTDLQCPVALKVINSNRMADEVNRNRFLREARAAAGLRHSNIASVYHLAKDAEQFFYAMEFIDGQTTEAYVARSGPMSLRAALRIAWQVSKALSAAARQQLVHRDIKPANIMIVADSEEDWPFVKLIDFGLVRSALRAHDSASTTQSGFVGTAQFASPEQIAENAVDVRSDIYSLGCTLWYLLTGEAPFCGSLASVFAQHLGSEPSWEKFRPFPKRFLRLLRRMLCKDPSQRPASAAELRREIEQCLGQLERREALAARIARPFNLSRQWLTAAPRRRGAVVCSVSVVGGLLLALGYIGNDGFSPRFASAVQTGSVVRAPDSNSDEQFAERRTGSSYLGIWHEPFQPLALERGISFAETTAPRRGGIAAKIWPPDNIRAAGATEPFALKTDFRNAKEDPLPASKALDGSFSAGYSENEKVETGNASIGEKDEAEKTTKRPVKKPQRRVASRDRDREFSPLEELQRARKNIKRLINGIL
jgi:serine/threonine protein kinase